MRGRGRGGEEGFVSLAPEEIVSFLGKWPEPGASFPVMMGFQRLRVSYERDTKIVNAASFTIEREDHTIGNILRMQLHRDPNVLFAGYKLPHPLQYKIIVRFIPQASPLQRRPTPRQSMI